MVEGPATRARASGASAPPRSVLGPSSLCSAWDWLSSTRSTSRASPFPSSPNRSFCSPLNCGARPLPVRRWLGQIAPGTAVNLTGFKESDEGRWMALDWKKSVVYLPVEVLAAPKATDADEGANALKFYMLGMVTTESVDEAVKAVDYYAKVYSGQRTWRRTAMGSCRACACLISTRRSGRRKRLCDARRISNTSSLWI